MRWSYDADCLISVGSKDRCVFQWEHHRLEEDDDGESLSSSDSDADFGETSGAGAKDEDGPTLVWPL